MNWMSCGRLQKEWDLHRDKEREREIHKFASSHCDTFRFTIWNLELHICEQIVEIYNVKMLIVYEK
jgi:hypothetical protein